MSSIFGVVRDKDMLWLLFEVILARQDALQGFENSLNTSIGGKGIFKADTLLVNYTRLKIGLGLLQLKPLVACFFHSFFLLNLNLLLLFIIFFINKSKIVKKSFEKLLKEKRNTVKCEFLSLCACSVLGKLGFFFKNCLNRHWASQDRRL